MGSLPDTMQAAYIERRGPADEIITGKLPVPRPKPGEVLVQVEAVAVNPVDTLIRSGAYHTPLPMPFVIGRDLAGAVVVTGEGVTTFVPGDRVWSNSLGYGGRQGPTAEFAVVPVERLYRLPGGVDPLKVVAAAHPAATAYHGLVHHVGHVHAGSVVLVGGGAGNVGICAVRIAASLGAKVIATAHGADDAAWCRRWGAAAVVDHHRDDLAEQVLAAAPGGVDVHFDTSGAASLETSLELLAPGGTIVLLAGYHRRLELPAGPFYTRDARLAGFAITNAPVADLARAAQAINGMFSEGALPVRIAEVLPLARAAEAHRRIEGTGGQRVRGRLLLRPDQEA